MHAPAPHLVAPPGLRPRAAGAAQLLDDLDVLLPDLASRARTGDRDGAFPFESLAALRALGLLRAPVPERLGGLGIDRVHDLVALSARLATADPSLAIGVNMHLVTVLSLARRWRATRAAGAAEQLQLIAETGVAIAAAASEPGQDLARPRTTARRVDGGGWRIDGTKISCTMSPAADLFTVAVTVVDTDGSERYGFAAVPSSARGVHVRGDWDALGMRSSGSHTVTFDDVRVAAGAVGGEHPVGETSTGLLARYLPSGLFHAAATLGVAESAFAAALGAAVGNTAKVSAVGDAAILLRSLRVVLAAGADVCDAHLDAVEAGASHDLDAAVEAFAAVQSAKATVDRGAPVVVDRAIEIVGAASYAAGHPLARAARDVRAGSFMHPLGANRVAAFVGRAELGLPPELR